MIKNIAIVVAILIAVLLAYAATRPDSFRLERSVTIKAPPEKAFALINDFHQWTAWSPWEHMDADLQRSYSGNAAGVGAVYQWEGKKTGVGRMEIMESLPASLIKIKLDFFKPFEAHNTAEFTLQAQGDSTTVTWAMYGPSPFMSKLMGIFFSIDKMVGKDFEAGLEKMKAAAEN
jgi:uncharacterized protein YndB with AHSA1/START domain